MFSTRAFEISSFDLLICRYVYTPKRCGVKFSKFLHTHNVKLEETMIKKISMNECTADDKIQINCSPIIGDDKACSWKECEHRGDDDDDNDDEKGKK